MPRKLTPAELPDWPRLLTRDLAIAYCGGRRTVFEALVAAGRLPPALTRGLWDRQAIDRALDSASGLADPPPPKGSWLEHFGGGDGAGPGR